MELIAAATTPTDFGTTRRLFGAYQRAVAQFASDSEICA